MSRSTTITIRLDERYFSELERLAGEHNTTPGLLAKSGLLALIDNGGIATLPSRANDPPAVEAITETIGTLLESKLNDRGSEIGKALKIQSASFASEQKKTREEIALLRKDLAELAQMLETPEDEEEPQSLLQFEE